MSKLKSFWQQFGIEGDEMIIVLNRLRKQDAKNLSNQEKIDLIRNIYKEKVINDKEFIDKRQNYLSKLKLKMQIENKKLLKIKAQDNFFKSEDKLQDFEENSQKIENEINKKMKRYRKNLAIYQKLDNWKKL